ncbi:MAG: hypothetical protein R3C03_16475 [Pirellulaceae bacterium]
MIYRIEGHSIVDWYDKSVGELHTVISSLMSDWKSPAIGGVAKRALETLNALKNLGLDDLKLNQAMQELSSGEKQRILIGRTLKTSLVNLLYVFDEVTSGLHPFNIAQIASALQLLHQKNNTIVVVDQFPQTRPSRSVLSNWGRRQVKMVEKLFLMVHRSNN